MEAQDKLRHANAEIAKLLNRVCDLFTQADDVRVTLVVRTPWLKDGGILMGNDDYDSAIQEINRLRTHEQVTTASRKDGAS